MSTVAPAAFAYRALMVADHASVTGALAVRDAGPICMPRPTCRDDRDDRDGRDDHDEGDRGHDGHDDHGDRDPGDCDKGDGRDGERDRAHDGCEDVLRLGSHATVQGDVRADRVRLDSHARVTGLLTSNALDLHKTATLAQPPASPLLLPLFDITPALPLVQPGAHDVVVPQGATVTLAAGAYRALIARAGSAQHPAVLRLAGGVVHAQRLELGARARLECVTSCELRLAGTLETGSHAALRPALAVGGQTAGGQAADLRVFVLSTSQGTVARFGAHGTFVAQVFAPFGAIQMEAHAELRGLLVGRTIELAAHARLNAEGALPPVVDGGVGAQDAGRDAGVDARADTAAPVVDAARDAARDATPVVDAARDAGRDAGRDATRDAARDAARDALPDAAPPCTSVGAAGGTVTSANGQATLDVPAGALSSSVCLRLAPAPIPPTSPPPSGQLGTAYTLEPAGTTFTQPATLRLTYDPAQLDSTPEATLALAEVQQSAWRVLAGSTVDLVNHRVSAPIASANTFGVVPSVCGDGVASGLEACDGSLPAGTTCESLGYLGGALVCHGDCTLDSSACVSCTPASCAAQGKNCGTLADGCGGTLTCGSCTPPQSCGGAGTPNVCGCAPTTCSAQGASCGNIPDGCGGTLSCGSCAAPETCGGAGTPNVCGCAPTTCAALGATCGSVANGCGGTLDCGSCTAPQSCGGAGTPNTCGCTPTTCTAQGASCGSIADGCGGTLDCGTCTAPQSCGGVGTPNTCGCTPTTCAAQGKDCGTISDGCGGTLDCGGCLPNESCGWGGSPNVCGATPPDPTTVAPPARQDVSTTVYASTAFLYSGANPIQTGVAPGTIELKRAAVLRGRVLDTQGNALPGVTLTVLNHPEFGQTTSRADGAFDLAANGGGYLTVSYGLPGYPTVQRRVNAPWQDYVHLPDVRMTPLDPIATTVTANAATMQVAQGSPVTDSDGTRRATLLFAPGTSAEMRLPNGTTQPLSTLTVRATEYTVGAGGPEAMPGPLPANVAYTYAVELSADEAIAAGATSVQFSQPVVNYVENFLGFPVGETVPVGSYDRERGVWIPEPSGRVVKILTVAAGSAELDLDGSGLPADVTALAALGVTPEELVRLATFYPVGQTLWRAALTHFSPNDYNWRLASPLPVPPKVPRPRTFDPDPEPCVGTGSIIECQNQVLGQRMPVSGTPFSLNYRSNRMRGLGHAVEITLTPADYALATTSIELTIQIAGQQFAKTFVPTPDLRHVFVWDGKDGYGRLVNGRQPASIRIDYLVSTWLYAPGSFGAPSGSSVGLAPIRVPYRVSQFMAVMLGRGVPAGQGLGGWSLSPVHAYDVGGHVLELGDGTQRTAQGKMGVFTNVAGNSDSFWGCPIKPNNIPATSTKICAYGIAVDGKGDLYIVGYEQIHRVDGNGTLTTVAGIGVSGFGGDGGPATSAMLYEPRAVAFDAAGNMFIAERQNHRIRRVDTNGIITTIAGTGVAGTSGDGGPAISAQLNMPGDLAITGDGRIYVLEWGSHRVRVIGPDGVIRAAAGNGVIGALNSGDGDPATSASLYYPQGIATDTLGALYISTDYYVRKVSPDGTIATVAGGGPWGTAGEGIPAIQAYLRPSHIAVDAQGTLFIHDSGGIKAMNTEGYLTTVAGGGPGYLPNGTARDGDPALGASLAVYGLALNPAGHLYISSNWRVRKVTPAVPGLSATDITIASDDASELYFFTGAGRHVATKSTTRGAPLYSFTYDGEGRLTQISDGDGNVTTVQRAANGEPTAIVGPYGQPTTLTVDGNGYLASVANPAGETTQMIYSLGGLLTSYTDPRNHTSTYAYDGSRLVEAHDAGGGSTTLSRVESPSQVRATVTKTTAENRVTTYVSETLPSGNFHQVNTFPGGLMTTSSRKPDGATEVTYPDGTQVTQVQGPEPRFGMQAPISKSTSVRLPSGLTRTVTQTRTAALQNPADPLNLTSQTDIVSVNGRTTIVVYNAAARTRTITSAAGRRRVLTLDMQGRVVRSEQPGLEPVTFVYDARGRLTSSTAGSGATARTSTFAYDVAGYLASVTDPLSRVLGLTYDAAGRTTRQTLPGAREVLFGYDAGGNTTALTPPGRTAHGFDYTPVDLPASYTPPSLGQGATTTSYLYNKDRQLTQLTRPDGQAVVFGYDAAGRLSTLTSPLGVRTYAYDAAAGHLTSITRADGGALAYSWDGALLTGTSWSGPVAGSVTQAYDSDFELATQTVAGSTVSFTRDNDRLLTGAGALALARDASTGFVTGSTLGTVSTTQTYDTFGAPATTAASAGGTTLNSTTYTRDALGRITQLDETVQGVTTSKVYSYDAAGRLWKVTVDGLLEAEYSYDANGNRLSEIDGLGGTTTATYDAQDRLVSYGSSTYSYTANGELSSKMDSSGTTTSSYDVYGQLTSVSLPDGTMIAYVADGQNRRVGKKVNGTLVQGWLYEDQLRIAAELDGAGAVVSRFVYATGVNVPAYMVKGGVTYRILTDHLGSVRLVVNSATGAVVQQIDYDAWGVVTNDTAPGFQPFGYAGGLYDRHTGWVRFGARDYDPTVGRWTAKEPLLFSGGEANLLAYAANDPVNNVDADGRFITQLAQGVLGRFGPLGALLSLAWRSGVFDIAPMQSTSSIQRIRVKGPYARPLEVPSDAHCEFQKKKAKIGRREPNCAFCGRVSSPEISGRGQGPPRGSRSSPRTPLGSPQGGAP